MRSKWYFIWKGEVSTARRGKALRTELSELTVTDGQVDVPASQDSLGPAGATGTEALIFAVCEFGPRFGLWMPLKDKQAAAGLGWQAACGRQESRRVAGMC